jgi:hypothetical protein
MIKKEGDRPLEVAGRAGLGLRGADDSRTQPPSREVSVRLRPIFRPPADSTTAMIPAGHVYGPLPTWAPACDV